MPVESNMAAKLTLSQTESQQGSSPLGTSCTTCFRWRDSPHKARRVCILQVGHYSAIRNDKPKFIIIIHFMVCFEA